MSTLKNSNTLDHIATLPWMIIDGAMDTGASLKNHASQVIQISDDEKLYVITGTYEKARSVKEDSPWNLRIRIKYFSQDTSRTDQVYFKLEAIESLSEESDPLLWNHLTVDLIRGILSSS